MAHSLAGAAAGRIACRPILTAALVGLAGCQDGGGSFQSACESAGHAAGSAAFDACVSERQAEVDRWNRIANRYRSGGP